MRELPPPKRQVARRAAFALGFGLVARAGETRPRHAPIVRLFGGPGEVE